MKKPSHLAIATAFSLLTILLAVSVTATVSVGVTKGNWIEYNVNIITLQPTDPSITVPSDHNITWARMEITNVQDDTINLNIQTKFANNTIIPANITLNLNTGILGDDFIIPANLNTGDTFFDAHQGNITITKIEQQTVAGAQRNVITGTTNETTYHWDQTTGILINAETTLSTYTLQTQANKTNLWEPQATPSSEPTLNPASQILGFDASAIFAIIIGIIAVLVIASAIIVIRRRSIKLYDQQT